MFLPTPYSHSRCCRDLWRIKQINEIVKPLRCVCVSPETHARYLQYRNQKRKSEGPMAAFPNNTFMFVSADNLDFIHGYARVYCGEQQSSWHGTTIQIVHPQPHNLSSPTDMNVTVSMTDVTNSENEVFNILPDTLSTLNIVSQKNNSNLFSMP